MINNFSPETLRHGTLTSVIDWISRLTVVTLYIKTVLIIFIVYFSLMRLHVEKRSYYFIHTVIGLLLRATLTIIT